MSRFLQKVMYLLCFSPCQIGVDTNDLLYIKTWYPQKLVCCMLTSLSSSYFFWETFQDLSRDKLKYTLITYFKAILTVINLLQRMLSTKFYWFDQNKFLALLSKVNKIPNNQINLKAVNRFILGIGSLTLGLSLFQIYEFIDLQVKLMIKISENKSCPICIIVLILKLLGRIHSNASLCAGSTCFLSTAYLVWHVSLSFKVVLEKTETNSKTAFDIWKDIESRFEVLCTVCKKFNEVYGHMVTCLVVEIVLYYAIEFEGFLASGVKHAASYIQMGFILYLLVSSMFLYFAADTNRNVGALKDWLVLKENRAVVYNSRDLTLILDQLNTNAVSVKASNVFPVTFGFVASVS